MTSSPISSDSYDLYSTPDKKIIQTHGARECEGTYCCLHNPSNHKMNKWPIVLREDKHWLAERKCPHGIGHPDPDSVRWIRETMSKEISNGIGIHGCDGCCR